MTRISPVDRDNAPEDVRRFYDADEERYGRVLGNTGVYAHNPNVLRAMKELVGQYRAMEAMPLRTKAILRTRVAVLNGCPF